MRPLPLLVVLCALLMPGAYHVAAQTFTGALEQGDAQLNSGEYVDWYTAEASVGDTLVIDMLSLSNLNPYLLLRGPNSQDRDNDDAATGDTRRSHIEYVVTAGGTFQVGATSYEPGEVGAYA
ncbi:MAG TPA: PPC domain-containing protein, partial [Rhodothermales bacterium]|nr:PPC domain-containing protein [Rhodothermales bacterium]